VEICTENTRDEKRSWTGYGVSYCNPLLQRAL
jgi:hypothetical protein